MHRRLVPLHQAFLRLEQRAATLVRRTFTGRPRALVATIAILAAVVLSSGRSVAWFAFDLTTGLPNRQALRDMGDMVQSTTIFDASDRPAFTIYKEQRIEVPLEKMSQNVIKAVISVEDQRFFDHSGVDAVRIGGGVSEEPAVGPPLRGRQHDHAAAGAADVPEPRQDAIVASSRKSSSRRTSRTCTRSRRFSRCTSIRCTSATACTASRRRLAAISASPQPIFRSTRRRSSPA